MQRTSRILIALAALVAGVVLLVRITTPIATTKPDGHDSHGHDHGSAEQAAEEIEKGPHGGRILHDGNFATEITIFERGVPPEFRIFFYERDAPIDPSQVKLEIELKRLNGNVDRHQFTPREGYLVSSTEVTEPHSFDVSVRAQHDGRTSQWAYSTYEGRVTLDDEIARSSGITVETAGPATIHGQIEVTGQIGPNEDRMAHLIPRFPGIVKETRKRLGDAVAAGEVLAVIQSNESLQLYDLRSGVPGTVIRKHVSPGEFVGEGEDVYVVADLQTVWVDLNVYRQDFARVKVGQKVRIDGGEGFPEADGTIAYLSPFGAPNTQTMLARVELPNASGVWKPGLYVSATVVAEETRVEVAVNTTALQTLRDWDVLFVRVGNVFEATPVELGRRDAERVEVLSGLQAGQAYADRGSFVLKAELGKAGASHDH